MAEVKYHVRGKADVKQQEISPDLQENLHWLKRYLGYKESFDIIVREFEIAGRACALMYIDSFVDQTVLTLIMEQMQRLTPDDLRHPSLRELLNRSVPFVEVTPESELSKTAEQILAGPAVLFGGRGGPCDCDGCAEISRPPTGGAQY